MDIEVDFEIQIRVMRVADHANFLPPDISSPSVQLEISPQFKAPRTVVERLSRISRSITLEGDMKGNLVLRSRQEAMEISTCFNSLRPRFEAMEEGEARENSCALKCDSKRVASLFQCQSIPIDTSILCFVEGGCLVLHVLLSPNGAGTLTYYLPAQSEEEDDDDDDDEEEDDDDDEGKY